ncbi:MAG: hypothetical protein FGM24_06390 [Candidatus Kapabacteria bacterium]|nr:hypothetical protein [Candidatus Kapabacteria bacterium]
MHRMFMSIAAFMLAATLVTAQDDRLGEISFDEVTLTEEKVPYFAVGVGFTASAMFPDLADVSAHATSYGLGELSGPMFVSGADIFTAIAIVPNVRAGFYWLGGGLETTGNIQVSNQPITRTMSYTFEMRGVYFDYAFVPTKGLAILPGLRAGWGTQSIELYQGAASRSWSDFAGPNDLLPSPDAYQLLQRDVLHVAPQLNIEYALTPFLNLRAAAAYQMQVSAADWISTKTSTVAGLPDGINMNAFSASIGVFVGLFN